MDPNTRGPEEYGRDGDDQSPRQRPPRESLTPDFSQHAPALARTVQLVSGDFLLTVNPVDGSEIEACPPAERPARPVKLTTAERAEAERAARPPVPPGPAQPSLPLLARQDERERLVRLLARGRSVRLTGPAGCGRTRLLDLVSESQIHTGGICSCFTNTSMVITEPASAPAIKPDGPAWWPNVSICSRGVKRLTLLTRIIPECRREAAEPEVASDSVSRGDFDELV